ncbi:Protein of unknown function [Gryllus bimaculatus]|nr:Protein of unknown function [Gryllus bimaculatus]
MQDLGRTTVERNFKGKIPSESDALDVLEARVAAVEARVFGPRGPAAAVAAGVVPSAKAAAAAGGPAGPLAVTASPAETRPLRLAQARPPRTRHWDRRRALASAHALLQGGHLAAARSGGRAAPAPAGAGRVSVAGDGVGAGRGGDARGGGGGRALAAGASRGSRRCARRPTACAAWPSCAARWTRGRWPPPPSCAAPRRAPPRAPTRTRDAALRVALQVAKLKEQQNAALEHVTLGLALLEAQVSRLEVAAMPRQPLD